MTTSRIFELTCNGCYETKTWQLSSLRNHSAEHLIKNIGYSIESGGSFLAGKKHYCPDCNDREKDTFYVYDGYGEEYLGTVKAWGRDDARRVGHDEYASDASTREIMVYDEKKERGDDDGE